MIATYLNEVRTIHAVKPDAEAILKQMGVKTYGLPDMARLDFNYERKEMQRFLNMCRSDFPLKAVFGDGWVIFGGVIDAPKGRICQHFHLYMKGTRKTFVDIGRLNGNPVDNTKENNIHAKKMIDLGLRLVAAGSDDSDPYAVLRKMMHGDTKWEGEPGVKGNTSDWGPI